jgi:8-oxo-dGTP diphosphatase
MDRKLISVTVDGIVVYKNKIVLVQRKTPPFAGYYALPGGFVEYGETVENAVIREVEEETGLKTRILKLVGVYSSPLRDPRGHTITIVYHLEVVSGNLKSGTDAKNVKLFRYDEIPKLAFDHEQILNDFISQSFSR